MSIVKVLLELERDFTVPVPEEQPGGEGHQGRHPGGQELQFYR